MDEMDISLGYKNNARNLKLLNRKPTLFSTPRKGKSISGRSTQSNLVICKTVYHTVESYGAPTPVQITEALAFSDRNIVCSASLSNDNWAWFVIGRRLLIWQVTGQKQIFGSSCKELTLPPSDLAYSANIISVFTLYGQQIVSCIAVSPEGLIRYWPNISNEGISIESNANLQGQECETVQRINPIGFILGTTTGTLLLIETNNIGGRHSITCRPLLTPSGWLGGIGRRFSSMLFGGIHSSQNTDAQKLIRIVIHENVSPLISTSINTYNLFVLTGYALQKWSLCVGEQEKLIYECNLELLIAENFEQTVWNASDDNEINICLIDMQLIDSTNQNIIILAVASNNIISAQLHYALVIINVDADTAPTRISSFFLLKNIDFSILLPEHNLKKISLLVSGQTVYMYNHRYIVSSPRGVIVNHLPIFFSRIHGFISVSPSDVISPLDFVNSSALSFDMSTTAEKFIIEESNMEEITMHKDGNACMKAAFLYYVSKKSNQAKIMINDMFPVDETSLQVDSSLDLVAIKVSLDLINDIPARDPRWADVKSTEKVNLNSTLSLQIQSQLEEKQQALDWFISFLREMGLWNRLGAVIWNNVPMATSYVFAEQAEKLIAAVVLKKLQNKYPQLLDTVIKDVVKNEDVISSSNLTAYDLFYRKVSIVHKALIQLCQNCEDYVCREYSVQSVVKTINDTNSILLQVLEEISNFRQEKGIVFLPNVTTLSNFSTEMLSWTAASGPDGLKDSLMLQSGITFKYGIKSVGGLTQRQELINQLISLNSIVLEGWKIHVESVSDRKARYEYLSNQYEIERLSLIQPFMELDEYESAATLAEKYLDFIILVQICDKTKDDDRLMYYMDKYEKKDFAQFLFSWYIREKKQGKLLSQFRSNKKHQQALAKFLVDHPSISWLHSVFCGNYEKAADVLLNLGFQEMESVKRKKCMLTLGKLALLAHDSTNTNLFDKVNKEINLIIYQEDLPEIVLSAFGYDFETMRVFLPAELIRFYICDENTNATEFDFNKALDLLHFIEDELERKDLKHEIWYKAITKDTWPDSNTDIDDPVEYIRQFLFFKIINFALEKDVDVLITLPPLEKIIESEDLGDLVHNQTFQYLLRFGYEYYSKRST
ncbi:hypothetical protein PGB90_007281 [Kerria lacca]